MTIDALAMVPFAIDPAAIRGCDPHRCKPLRTAAALPVSTCCAPRRSRWCSRITTRPSSAISRPFGWFSEIGWVGVDLFFVLSGYLIGNQIFSGIARGQPLSLKRFYARRFLRTLPNYYGVLALHFLFPLTMGGKTPPPLWRFLTFTQNLGLHPGTAFSHAWSLCIEEQFYLLLPLIALIGVRQMKSVRTSWIFLIH